MLSPLGIKKRGFWQVKKAIEKGNIDGAKIYAQNAIRKKTEALNYLRLASRLDAVVSRLDTQAKMNMINSSMSQIVRALDKVSICAYIVYHLNAVSPWRSSGWVLQLLDVMQISPLLLLTRSRLCRLWHPTTWSGWPPPWTNSSANLRTWTCRANLWRAP